MTIQVLLTLGLLLCAAYAFLQVKVSAFLHVVIYTAALAGTYFVWFPEHTTVVAQLLGVGRGADLVLYLWVVISIAIGFNLHVKLATESRKTTLLARHIAIRDAWEPERAGTPHRGGGGG